MLTKKELFQQPEYWIEEIQNELYGQVTDFMKTNSLNQNELAEKWGVSKGYISQILKGDCNFTLKKMVELSLAMGKAPILQYVPVEVYYEVDKLIQFLDKGTNETFSITIKKGKNIHMNISAISQYINVTTENSGKVIKMNGHLAA